MWEYLKTNWEADLPKPQRAKARKATAGTAPPLPAPSYRSDVQAVHRGSAGAPGPGVQPQDLVPVRDAPGRGRRGESQGYPERRRRRRTPRKPGPQTQRPPTAGSSVRTWPRTWRSAPTSSRNRISDLTGRAARGRVALKWTRASRGSSPMPRWADKYDGGRAPDPHPGRDPRHERAHWCGSVYACPEAAPLLGFVSLVGPAVRGGQYRDCDPVRGASARRHRAVHGARCPRTCRPA